MSMSTSTTILASSLTGDGRVPAAEGFDGSSKAHAIYGRSLAPEVAKMDGPLLVSSIFCPCDSCEAFDFSPGACKMRHEYGAFKLEYARRTVQRDPRTTRTQSLEAFALSLKKGQVQALAAHRADRHMEGNVWLCLLLSDAFVAKRTLYTRLTKSRLAGGW